VGSVRQAPAEDASDAPAAGRAEGVKVRYEDADLLVLERLPSGSAQELRWRAGRREATKGRPAGRGAWPVGSVETGLTGLLLLARSAAAKRRLQHDPKLRVCYLAAVEARDAGVDAAGSARLDSTRTANESTRPARDRRTQGPRGKGDTLEILGGTGLRRLLRFDRLRAHRDLLTWLERRGYRVLRDVDHAERVYLHASELEFEHPTTGQSLRFESPAAQDLARVGGAGGDSLRAERTQPPASPRSAARRPATHPSTDWGAVAEWFDVLLEEKKHDHYRDVILPGALRLLDLGGAKRVLDVASGQGMLCRALAERGIESVGVEAAPRLVELADERSRGFDPRPRFELGDARELGRMQLGDFDRIACIMALTNIEPIQPVIAACQSKLRPGGAFVCVIAHPAFRIPKRSRWEWSRDAAGAHRQSRVVDAYLSSVRVPIVANPGEVAAGARPLETWTFHRPLEFYVRSLAQAGLYVDAIEEWISQRESDSGPRAPEENRARREIPLFMAIRARKLEA